MNSTEENTPAKRHKMATWEIGLLALSSLATLAVVVTALMVKLRPVEMPEQDPRVLAPDGLELYGPDVSKKSAPARGSDGERPGRPAGESAVEVEAQGRKSAEERLRKTEDETRQMLADTDKEIEQIKVLLAEQEKDLAQAENRVVSAQQDSVQAKQKLAEERLAKDSSAPKESTGLKMIDARRCGAKGDGVQDDTAALRQALMRAKEEQSVVLLPAGTYLISGPLEVAVPLIGQSAEQVTMRFQDRAEGFADPAHLKAILVVPDGQAERNVFVARLTLDGGAGNSGALGLTLESGRAEFSGLRIKNVGCGIVNHGAQLTIRNLESDHAVVALRNSGLGSVLLTDATLTGGTAQEAALVSESPAKMTLKNVNTSGFGSALKVDGKALDRINLDAWNSAK